MIIKSGTVVLVTDGGRTLLLRNEGDTKFPDLRVIAGVDNIRQSNRQQMSDAPGVTRASMSSGRSTYDEAKPHQQNEDRFLAQAASMLADAVVDGGKAEVIVVAPPRSLAVLRRHRTPAVEKLLIAEIDKDLTRHSVLDITRHLQDHEARMPVRG